MTTVERLAAAFAGVLKEWLTDAEWKAVARRNAAEPDPNVCHSHDFCDANMAMDEAFTIVLRRHARPVEEADAELWNEAWNLAKVRYIKEE